MTENPIPTPQKARYLMYFADPMCSLNIMTSDVHRNNARALCRPRMLAKYHDI